MERKSFVILSAVMIGVIMALCIGAAGGAPGNIGANLAYSIPASQGGHGIPVPATGATQDNGINADTISMDGGVTYTHNETFWVAPASQIVEENYASGVSGQSHATGGFYITIKPQTGVWVDTPFVNPINIDGIHPKVRYIYYRMSLPKNVNVTETDYQSGSYYQAFYVNWVGNDSVKEATLDLGSYRDMSRGINTGLYLYNYNATNSKNVILYGAGERSEW